MNTVMLRNDSYLYLIRWLWLLTLLLVVLLPYSTVFLAHSGGMGAGSIYVAGALSLAVFSGINAFMYFYNNSSVSLNRCWLISIVIVGLVLSLEIGIRLLLVSLLEDDNIFTLLFTILITLPLIIANIYIVFILKRISWYILIPLLSIWLSILVWLLA